MPQDERLWVARDLTFDLSRRGEIMGILNVTPDSFSDGGRFCRVGDAIAHAERMIAEGAAIIDVGGESTRPGAGEVPLEEEIARTIPVIAELVRRFPRLCVSIDTSKPEVARRALGEGARVINDIGGFRDGQMIRVAAEVGAGTVVMHMQGTPRTMQEKPEYGDVVEEVRAFFAAQFDRMTDGGVDPRAIVLDPGIGFGKSLEHNLALLRALERLPVAGRPLLLGVSRKSFIGALLGRKEMEDRSAPTVGITAYATEMGVRLHRVHEVKPNLESMRMIEAIFGRP